jgi:hypothetical protein
MVFLEIGSETYAAEVLAVGGRHLEALEHLRRCHGLIDGTCFAYQIPRMPRASSQLATTVVFPAPGGPTTQMARRLSRSASRRANRRSRATAPCRRGRVSLASRAPERGTPPPPEMPMTKGFYARACEVEPARPGAPSVM